MTGYASKTTVTPARTRNEIEHELDKRGATAFGFNREGNSNVIAFALNGLRVRMELTMPDPTGFKDYTAGNGRRVSGQKVYDEEVARRWRALALVVKAKLVAVDEDITSLEREFLADVVLADGMTVLEATRQQIEGARAAIEAPAQYKEEKEGGQ